MKSQVQKNKDQNKDKCVRCKKIRQKQLFLKT